ncbi:MAG: hypothetical protein HY040_27230, partial [Planctomycetes bacterium]|nr:hypothetical protein [Planctomycetota bacterium]
EGKQTLGTVTERLQRILQTVRRDPSKSEKVRIDLNAMAREMQSTWVDLAREKWKLVLDLEPYLVEGKRAPLWIEGDVSHLQQAIENLLFNARDATFEMRNHLREQARVGLNSPSVGLNSPSPLGGEGLGVRGRDSFSREPTASAGAAGNGLASAALDPERRQALIDAAGWKGHVTIHTSRAGTDAILEVSDNGIGMTEETRRRCLETHFSTKRDNALFAGLSAGMGLGLSFVTVILEHHKAKLEIDSAPLQGTTFRVRFPLYP